MGFNDILEHVELMVVDWLGNKSSENSPIKMISLID